MITEQNSPPATQLVRIGWPWHGLLRRAGADSADTELVLPGGGVMRHGDPVSADPGDGAWSIGALINAENTYLWDVGLPDVEDPIVEALDGAWWGKAILRGSNPSHAYGALQVAMIAGGGDFFWPIWLGDGVKGHVCAKIRFGDFHLTVCEDATLGAEPAASYDVPIAGIDLEQSSPPVYIAGGLVSDYSISELLDITPDGRSALFSVTATRAVGPHTKTITLGVVRLDITGAPGSISAALSVAVSRAAAMGELIDEDVGGLTLDTLMNAPEEYTSEPSGPPACSTSVRHGDGIIVPATGTPSATYRGMDGTWSRTCGQAGTLAGAWFGPAGEVEVIRYDFIIEESTENTRTDLSSGAFDEVITYTYTGGACEESSVTVTDTREFKLQGQIVYNLIYRVNLYDAAGTLATTVEHEFRSDAVATVSSESAYDVIGTRHMEYLIDGAHIVDVTNDDVPLNMQSLGPGASGIWGETVLREWPAFEYDSRYPVLSAPIVGAESQIGVMRGSNKCWMLASLRQGLVNYLGETGDIVTPNGSVTSAVAGDVVMDVDSAIGLENGGSQNFVRASYNPVTHAVARAYPDYQIVSWV